MPCTAPQSPLSGSTQFGPPIKIFDLERHRSLFRDDAAFHEFVSMMVGRVVDGGVTILVNKEVALATMTSAVQARNAFLLRIATRLADDPTMIDTLSSRVNDGKFVEWDKLEIEDPR